LLDRTAGGGCPHMSNLENNFYKAAIKIRGNTKSGNGCQRLQRAIGLKLRRFCPENYRLTHGFPVATAGGAVATKRVVANGEPMRRFEELCELIAIERDVEIFSTLVTELNRLDPTRRLPVVSKQPPPSDTLQN
jgi:hypothetical protein